MRIVVRLLAWLAVLIVGLWVMGPRVELDAPVPDPEVPDAGPEGVQAVADWVRSGEARFDDLVPGTEKLVVWADPAAPAPTPLSLVYLHGFSATRQEVAPLAELLADSLGANLFLTRLTGHGRGPEPMGRARLEDWLGDALEAMAVGERLGERVVVMGTSTGGSLAIWLAAQPEVRDRIAALLLISPNLGLPDPRARILLWPWGGALARALQGPERSFEPLNALQERYWTTRYPVEALLPLMATVRTVERLSFGEVRAPVWIAYDPDDPVVDPSATEARFPEFSSPRKLLLSIPVPEGGDAHVLAGDIVNPRLTERVLGEILDFLESASLTRDPEG